jgi:hypothetical protein
MAKSHVSMIPNVEPNRSLGPTHDQTIRIEFIGSKGGAIKRTSKAVSYCKIWIARRAQ